MCVQNETGCTDLKKYIKGLGQLKLEYLSCIGWSLCLYKSQSRGVQRLALPEPRSNSQPKRDIILWEVLHHLKKWRMGGPSHQETWTCACTKLLEGTVQWIKLCCSYGHFPLAHPEKPIPPFQRADRSPQHQKHMEHWKIFRRILISVSNSLQSLDGSECFSLMASGVSITAISVEIMKNDGHSMLHVLD